MIDCLSNLVGIRTSCGDQVVSDSGLYLQDLPFINLKTADAIVTDQDSGYALMQQKLNIAHNYLVNDIRQKMLPYFKSHSVVENDIIGYYMDNMPPVDPQSAYKGIQIKIMEYPFLSIYISSVSLFIDFTGDVDIKVYDLTQNKVIDTIQVSAVAGEIVQVDIHKEYQTNGQTLNLFFAYDASSISSYQTNTFSPGYIGYTSCRGCARRRDAVNEYIYAYQKTLPLNTPAIQQNLQQSNSTGGISLTYSVACSLEKWICQNRVGFAMALLHRAGMELIKEFLISNRINSLVTLKKDDAEKLSLDFQAEYDKSMDNVLKNMRIPNDICFKCQKRVSTRAISV